MAAPCAHAGSSSLLPAAPLPQGIKFYDPEIVGDTPESVEWRGMQVGRQRAPAEARFPLPPLLLCCCCSHVTALC